MGRPRKLPDIETLRRLRREGLTYAEIAERYDVTDKAVYWALSQGGATAGRPHYDRHIPWTVRSDQQHEHPVRMLRALGRKDAGENLTRPVERMLEKWLKELAGQELVVAYDPSYPPNPASPTKGGWAYFHAEPSDWDALKADESLPRNPVHNGPLIRV